jgi:hypothetical protein
MVPGAIVVSLAAVVDGLPVRVPGYSQMLPVVSMA